MSRYIDADIIRDEWLHEVNENIFCPNDVLDSIDSQPDADVEQVRHAHWIKIGWGKANYPQSKCSRCYEQVSDGTEYCPCCGAKMNEKVII